MTVKIHTCNYAKGHSFKLSVNSGASVQDYLDAVNRFYQTGDLTRLWPNNLGHCEGCHYCCHEPAPVTLQDAFRLMEGLHTDLPGLFQYLWVEEQQGAIDITLNRLGGDRCTFLKPDDRCAIYQYRPLVCQTYICCPQNEDHEALRSVIVNQGEDALIHQSIKEFSARGQLLPVNKGSNQRIRLQDWPPNQLSKVRNYRQLRLQDILPQKLYRKLQDK